MLQSLSAEGMGPVFPVSSRIFSSRSRRHWWTCPSSSIVLAEGAWGFIHLRRRPGWSVRQQDKVFRVTLKVEDTPLAGIATDIVQEQLVLRKIGGIDQTEILRRHAPAERFGVTHTRGGRAGNKISFYLMWLSAHRLLLHQQDPSLLWPNHTGHFECTRLISGDEHARCIQGISAVDTASGSRGHLWLRGPNSSVSTRCRAIREVRNAAATRSDTSA